MVYGCHSQSTIEQIKTISGKSITAAKLDSTIKSIMDSVQVPGLSIAIINDSKIVYHNTFGVSNIETQEPITKESIFEAASLSKPLFAYFAMKQVEKGILDLDKPLFKYLPHPDVEYDERYQSITARMVLSHTTGFPNWRKDDNKDGKLYIKFTPGRDFNYSGEGYQYLAAVVAKINGTDLNGLDEIFQKEVARPLKAEILYYNRNDKIKKHKVYGHNENGPTENAQYDGNTFGAAYSLHTEAVSYAQFLIAMLKKEGLAENSFDEMLKEQVHFKDDNHLKQEVGQTGWGLGLAQKPTEHGMMHLHTGNNHDFQTYMMILPEKEFGIVFFMNAGKAIPFIQNLNAVIGPIF
ncbi:serine hydrolase domain-containing protein [Flagellimonas sp. S174]|uniref:serine hydrolase domain-containing protein n=1 Tax=Flagellimonas sp. S174 TaxID=3410790 RepID=UPI003BF4B157